MSIVDLLAAGAQLTGLPHPCDDDGPQLQGNVDVYVDPWRKQIKDLAQDGAITPNSSLPMAQSLHHILRHVKITGRDQDEVDVAALYGRAENFAVRLHDFQRHAARWAFANSALIAPEPGTYVTDRLPGMTLREVPLTENEVAAFLEGWSAR